MRNTVIACLLLSALAVCPISSQTVSPRSLPVDTTPADGDLWPVWKSSPLTTRYVTIGTLKTVFTPTSRTISCTPPLLCTGGSSFSLNADQVLSIEAGTLISIYTCNGVDDTAAIDSRVAEIQAALGGILRLSGTCIYDGAGISNNPAVSTYSPLVIEGEGRTNTLLDFDGCSNPQCIYLGHQNPVGSGYEVGSGVRHIALAIPLAKDGIVIEDLDSFQIEDVYVYGGSSGIVIKESRNGLIHNVLGRDFSVNGIKVVGDNFAANMYSWITLTSLTATGSGFIYDKVGTNDAGGIYLDTVVVNGTIAGNGISITGNVVSDVFAFCDGCVADGNFGVSAMRFVNTRNVTLVDPFAVNQAAATNGTGILLDNTSFTSITAGTAYANTGASGADLSLKNSVESTSVRGIQLTGPTRGVLVDATNHDIELKPSVVIAATYISDPTKIVPASTTKQFPAAVSLVSNQYLSSYNSTTGAWTQSQPGFSNLSGSLSCSQAPALTGDVTTSAGACATTIGVNAVTDSKASNDLTIASSNNISTALKVTLGTSPTTPAALPTYAVGEGTNLTVTAPSGEGFTRFLDIQAGSANTASQIRFLTQDNAVSGATEKMRIENNLRLFGAGPSNSTFGTLVIGTGSAPTNNVADATQCWTADVIAGDANLFCRNEAGIVEQLTGRVKRVKAQFDKTSSTALSNVTDLTFNVAVGAYGFSAILYTSSNVAGGIKAAVGGTATVSSVIYEGDIISGATIGQTRAVSIGSAVCAVTAVTTARCEIKGSIVVNAAGTITIQFAQNASNGTASSVLVGSTFRIESHGN